MSKIYTYIILSLFAIILFTSCEEEVDLDLNPVENKLNIDATIAENEGCVVYLTKLKGINEDSPYDKVSGANIIIENNGNSYTLNEVEGGKYTYPILGQVGQTYKLKVTVDGQTYSAQSTMPSNVPIDSLYIYNLHMGSDDNYFPCVKFLDPEAETNYYYFKVWINGMYINQLDLEDDKFRNGLVIRRFFPYDKEEYDDKEIVIGDVVEVEMQMLDKASYDYYKSISSDLSNGSNPISNFSGGDVLGNFKAYSKSKAKIIVREDHIFTP